MFWLVFRSSRNGVRTMQISGIKTALVLGIAILSVISDGTMNVLSSSTANDDERTLEDFPLRSQVENMLCGAAVCQMILNYYEHPCRYMGQIDMAHKFDWEAGRGGYSYPEGYLCFFDKDDFTHDENVAEGKAWEKIVIAIDNEHPVHISYDGHSRAIVDYSIKNVGGVLEYEVLEYNPLPPGDSEYEGGHKEWVSWPPKKTINDVIYFNYTDCIK